MAALAANAVLVAHLAFVGLVVFGGLLVVWRPRLAWLHLPALAWGTWISVTHGTCPLTPLEKALRRAAGEPGFAEGFVNHYLMPLIYPPGLTARGQLVLAALLVACNALLYGWALLRHRSRPKSP